MNRTERQHMATPRTNPANAPSAPARTAAAYHHGDLRAALLAAAELELAEKGVDGFTLRGCARRAGVSHAAPAHHFKDVRALLTALAAIGFARLSASMADCAEGIPPGGIDYIVAIGRGYVRFAVDNPHLYNLIFRSALLDCDDPVHGAAGDSAFAYPVRAVGAYRGSDDPMSDPQLAIEVVGIWSMVHGLAGLLIDGQFSKHTGKTQQQLADELAPALTRQFMEGPAKRPDPAGGC